MTSSRQACCPRPQRTATAQCPARTVATSRCGPYPPSCLICVFRCGHVCRRVQNVTTPLAIACFHAGRSVSGTGSPVLSSGHLQCRGARRAGGKQRMCELQTALLLLCLVTTWRVCNC